MCDLTGVSLRLRELAHHLLVQRDSADSRRLAWEHAKNYAIYRDCKREIRNSVLQELSKTNPTLRALLLELSKIGASLARFKRNCLCPTLKRDSSRWPACNDVAHQILEQSRQSPEELRGVRGGRDVLDESHSSSLEASPKSSHTEESMCSSLGSTRSYPGSLLKDFIVHDLLPEIVQSRDTIVDQSKRWTEQVLIPTLDYLELHMETSLEFHVLRDTITHGGDYRVVATKHDLDGEDIFNQFMVYREPIIPLTQHQDEVACCHFSLDIPTVTLDIGMRPGTQSGAEIVIHTLMRDLSITLPKSDQDISLSHLSFFAAITTSVMMYSRNRNVAPELPPIETIKVSLLCDDNGSGRLVDMYRSMFSLRLVGDYADSLPCPMEASIGEVLSRLPCPQS